jgi:Ca2+:H+ antiporter
VFVPVAIAFRYLPSLENPTALFVISCLAIVPMAGWMGRATEHLGQGVGGRKAARQSRGTATATTAPMAR